MAGPVQWAPPVDMPAWTPPDDAAAGISSGIDEFGRAASVPTQAPRAPQQAPQITGAEAMRRLDEELERNLAAANASLDGQPQAGPAGPGDVLGGQMQSSIGSYGDAASMYAQNLPRSGRRFNVAHPFAQQAAGERHDQSAAGYEQAVPFQPTPFQPLPRYEDETDEEWQARNETFAAFDMQSQRDDYERQRQEWLTTGGKDLANLDTRDIGRAPGAIGMEEAQLQGQENVDAARLQQNEALALEQAKAADKQAEATLAVVQQQEEQRALEDAQMEAHRRITSTREEARKALSEMPQRSREQIAKGLSKGNKVAAVLAAIGQGWRGDPITAVDDAIGRGVQDQLDGYDRKRAEYGDIIDQADDEMRMMDFIMTSVGGNRAAAATLLRELHMEDTIADFAAAEAKTSTPIAAAQYEQGRIGLTDMLRKETAQFDLQAAKTPEYVGVKIDTPLMKFKRELAKGGIEDAREEQMDIRKEGRGVAIKDWERAADADVALGLEGAKSQGAVQAKRAEKAAEWENKVKERTAGFGMAQRQISEFLDRNQGNIHGRGWVWSGDSDQRIDTDSFLESLKLSITTAWTGANASPQQIDQFNKLVEGDWSEFSDDALRARLRSLDRLMGAQSRYLQDSIAPKDAPIANTRELSTFQAR